jgi:hypothetical protein
MAVGRAGLGMKTGGTMGAGKLMSIKLKTPTMKSLAIAEESNEDNSSNGNSNSLISLEEPIKSK